MMLPDFLRFEAHELLPPTPPLPPDLALPTDSPIENPGSTGNDSSDGTDWTLVLLAAAVAFVAGGALSSTYFLARGRSA